MSGRHRKPTTSNISVAKIAFTGAVLGGGSIASRRPGGRGHRRRMGPGSPLRVRRQLGNQHRQRLSTAACNSPQAPGPRMAAASTPRRLSWPPRTSRSRSLSGYWRPRVVAPGPCAVAGCRARPRARLPHRHRHRPAAICPGSTVGRWHHRRQRSSARRSSSAAGQPARAGPAGLVWPTGSRGSAACTSCADLAPPAPPADAVPPAPPADAVPPAPPADAVPPAPPADAVPPAPPADAVPPAPPADAVPPAPPADAVPPAPPADAVPPAPADAPPPAPGDPQRRWTTAGRRQSATRGSCGTRSGPRHPRERRAGRDCAAVRRPPEDLRLGAYSDCWTLPQATNGRLPLAGARRHPP